MLTTLLSIIGIIFTILFIVGTHEFGHFIVARMVGVKVLRFSIGFGKSLFSWRGKNGTKYVFALIPLGGYVQMLDENEVNVAAAEKHLAYNQQPYFKKLLIAIAGPITNLICAFALYVGIFLLGFTTLKPVVGDVSPDSIAARAGIKPDQEIIKVDHYETNSWLNIVFRLLAHAGEEDTLSIQVQSLTGQNKKNLTLKLKNWQMDELTPDPLKSLGIKPYQPNIPLVIDTIAENSPANRAGIQQGDKIIAIDKMQPKDWSQVIEWIHDSPDETLDFLIQRNSKTLNIKVSVGSRSHYILWQQGYLGIGPKIDIPQQYLQKIQYGMVESVKSAAQQVYTFCYFNFLILGKLITGKLSVQSLGGPISIFGTAGSAIHNGIVPFLSFLAFLSIAIGIINILPIPGLDGGHILLETVAFIIRRPIPESILMFLYRFGVFVIIFILIQALVNDILRMY